jgi:hypothetical protein
VSWLLVGVVKDSANPELSFFKALVFSLCGVVSSLPCHLMLEEASGGLNGADVSGLPLKFPFIK